MEAQDVLADDMHIGGPQSAELLALLPVRLVGIIPDGGNIVDQRIQPDVSHVAGVKGHGDSPRKGGTGHAQILQSCLEEIVDHFLLAALRLDEVRMLIKVGHESVGVPAHAEEVRLLAGALDGSAAVGASAVRRLRIGEEGFARLAVPALVAGFIDVALVIKALEQLLHAVLVPGDVGIDLGIAAVQPVLGHHGVAAVAGAGEIDHVQVAALDDPVQMGIDEVLARAGAPVAHDGLLEVALAQRTLQQRVVQQIQLACGQVIGGAPVGVDLIELLLVQRRLPGQPRTGLEFGHDDSSLCNCLGLCVPQAELRFGLI